MPRTLRPERYPLEFFELTLHAWRSRAPLEIPCASRRGAFGLRTKLYVFWAALGDGVEEGVGPLTHRLVSSQRLPPSHDSDPGWEARAASDLLAAAADLEATVNGTSLILAPKSQNPYALLIRAALDRHRGSNAEASLDRLQELLRTPPTSPEGEEK